MDAFKRLARFSGFTLIELTLVVIIVGILSTIAISSLSTVTQTAKIEETKRELDYLAHAIAGDPNLNNNGVRYNFGYVGDIGALPENLDMLFDNPGYASWRGPYVANRFIQVNDDFKTDAWGMYYAYDGLSITSLGSGSAITRRVASSAQELLNNTVSGVVLDADGSPPGNVYRDSIELYLTVPNGSGGYTTRLAIPGADGYFEFDSVPIGNHDLTIVYLHAGDTLRRFTGINPGSNLYDTYLLSADHWRTEAMTDTTLDYVPGSDTLYGGQCNRVRFWIRNASPVAITVTSMIVSWEGPTAYYKSIDWNSTTVVNSPNPSPGSGDLVAFSSPQTIAPGEQVQIAIDLFKANPAGGKNVNMELSDFTIELSDGSILEFSTGEC